MATPIKEQWPNASEVKGLKVYQIRFTLYLDGKEENHQGSIRPIVKLLDS